METQNKRKICWLFLVALFFVLSAVAYLRQRRPPVSRKPPGVRRFEPPGSGPLPPLVEKTPPLSRKGPLPELLETPLDSAGAGPPAEGKAWRLPETVVKLPRSVAPEKKPALDYHSLAERLAGTGDEGCVEKNKKYLEGPVECREKNMTEGGEQKRFEFKLMPGLEEELRRDDSLGDVIDKGKLEGDITINF